MKDEITEFGLTCEAESLAREIFDEYRDAGGEDWHPYEDEDDMMDRAHEYADGHAWVIYTHKALRLCAECNTDRGEEFVDDVGLPEPFTLAGAAAAVAYGELRARIEEALRDLIEAYEEPEDSEDEGAAG